ncbi:MAG: hypothetical protein ACOYMW_00355 [Candidatus Competibacteraceae bacterium]
MLKLDDRVLSRREFLVHDQFIAWGATHAKFLDRSPQNHRSTVIVQNQAFGAWLFQNASVQTPLK